jgi:pimeloyl-ACP methyl ester carboxylesterase
MPEFEHKVVQTNGIRMHLAEVGKGFPIVLCHAFPEIWYSWRRQMRALAAAGLRAIAPDQRGYGETDCPDQIESYTQRHLVGDVLGMLDALEIGKCVIVGQGWGGVVAWNAALMAPDRIERVVSIRTPFMPRPSVRPTKLMAKMAGENFHLVLYIQRPGKAEAELEKDVRRTLRGFFHDISNVDVAEIKSRPPYVWGPEIRGILDQLPDKPHGKYLTDEDFETYVKAFEHTGFRGGLNWYRAIDRSWEEAAELVDLVTQPALMISSEFDSMLGPETAAGIRRWVPNLKETVLVRGAGHWPEQEKPADVNAALLRFLNDLQ